MYQILLILCIFIEKGFLFQQNDYKFSFERAELVTYDKTFLKDFKMFTYKYNRTTPVVNATVTYIQDAIYDLQVVVQAYVFLSNEYRQFPALRFQFSFCEAAYKNDFGLERIYACGNFTRCPIRKGTYHVCKWSPNELKFPPRIPNAKYKFRTEIYHSSTNIMVIDGYGIVHRPIRIEA